MASSSFTSVSQVLDVERLLNKVDAEVAEAISLYGVNATAVLFLPADIDPLFHNPTEDPKMIGASIQEVVEAAALRENPPLVTWYGLETLTGSPAYLQMPDGTAAKIKLIGSVETFTSTPTYERVNALWLASFEAPPTGASLNTVTANIYDGLWILSLSVIEANSTEPLKLMKVIPSVASNYVGATGRCTLNTNGDRLGADFDFYEYTLVEGVVKSVQLGSYSWEANQFTWNDASLS